MKIAIDIGNNELKYIRITKGSQQKQYRFGCSAFCLHFTADLKYNLKKPANNWASCQAKPDELACWYCKDAVL